MTPEDVDNMNGRELLGTLVATALLITAQLLVRGAGLWLLWNWFAVPILSLSAVTLGYAVCLWTLVLYLRPMSRARMDKTMWALLWENVAATAVIVGVAYVVRLAVFP